MEEFYSIIDGWIKTYEELDSLCLSKTLFLVRCCGVKSKIEKGLSKDIYISNINQNFYKQMENNNYDYATISDKYGIVYPNDLIENYDLHPSKLTEQEKLNLVNKIKDQLRDKYDTLIFYNFSPLMSIFYLKILKQTGLKIYFISKLDILNKIRKRSLF